MNSIAIEAQVVLLKEAALLELSDDAPIEEGFVMTENEALSLLGEHSNGFVMEEIE